MYIDQLLIKNPVSAFFRERPFFANKHVTSARSMFIFRGTHVGQQRNEESVITCQIMPNDHGSLLDSKVNMQLASPNPLVIKVFFGQGHPLQKAL
jgi:hypothetical protein